MKSRRWNETKTVAALISEWRSIPNFDILHWGLFDISTDKNPTSDANLGKLQFILSWHIQSNFLFMRICLKYVMKIPFSISETQTRAVFLLLLLLLCHVFYINFKQQLLSFFKLEHFLRPFLTTRSHVGSAHTFGFSLQFLEVLQKWL